MQPATAAIAFSTYIPAHVVQPKTRRECSKVRCFDQRPKYFTYGRSRRSAVLSMSSERSEGREDDVAGNAEPQTHVTMEFARRAFDDAISLADDNIHTVAQTCATGFTDAFKQCYSLEEDPSIFVVCGPGLTGLIGLYAALQLQRHGYDASVHAVKSSKYMDVSSFCEHNGLPLFDFIPSTIEFYYQVIVDALLGVGFDGGDIREPYWQVQEMLVATCLPVASVDVPTGWDLTTGPRPIDVSADTFIKPNLLVSLGAPLPCAKAFAGEYHFIAGRHLPENYYTKNGISVPLYPRDAHSVLFGSSLKPYHGTGAVYGRPGQFNATLFTKNPRRRWVDVEEEMDLWDELD